MDRTRPQALPSVSPASSKSHNIKQKIQSSFGTLYDKIQKKIYFSFRKLYNTIHQKIQPSFRKPYHKMHQRIHYSSIRSSIPPLYRGGRNRDTYLGPRVPAHAVTCACDNTTWDGHPVRGFPGIARVMKRYQLIPAASLKSNTEITPEYYHIPPVWSTITFIHKMNAKCYDGGEGGSQERTNILWHRNQSSISRYNL